MEIYLLILSLSRVCSKMLWKQTHPHLGHVHHHINKKTEVMIDSPQKSSIIGYSIGCLFFMDRTIDTSKVLKNNQLRKVLISDIFHVLSCVVGRHY
jgi:hypothetical protein